MLLSQRIVQVKLSLFRYLLIKNQTFSNSPISTYIKPRQEKWDTLYYKNKTKENDRRSASQLYVNSEGRTRRTYKLIGRTDKLIYRGCFATGNQTQIIVFNHKQIFFIGLFYLELFESRENLARTPLVPVNVVPAKPKVWIMKVSYYWQNNKVELSI